MASHCSRRRGTHVTLLTLAALVVSISLPAGAAEKNANVGWQMLQRNLYGGTLLGGDADHA